MRRKQLPTSMISKIFQLIFVAVFLHGVIASREKPKEAAESLRLWHETFQDALNEYRYNMIARSFWVEMLLWYVVLGIMDVWIWAWATFDTNHVNLGSSLSPRLRRTLPKFWNPPLKTTTTSIRQSTNEMKCMSCAPPPNSFWKLRYTNCCILQSSRLAVLPSSPVADMRERR